MLPMYSDYIKKIVSGNWKNLIILDACRFDCFKDLCFDYLRGELKKEISPAYNTQTWLRRVFDNKKFDDVIYISANPYVNSLRSDIVKGFGGEKCFYKIIDVWNEGWNNKLKTVHPTQVREKTELITSDFPNKRLICHFMQPHQPYINLEPLRRGFERHITYLRENKKNLDKHSNSRVIQWVKDKLRVIISNWFESGKQRTYIVKKLLGLRKPEPSELVAKKYGKDKLSRAYMENLKIVLEEVSKLLRYISGRTIVTSDHGELLGEDGFYSHQFDHPLLREVPWLQIEL